MIDLLMKPMLSCCRGQPGSCTCFFRLAHGFLHMESIQKGQTLALPIPQKTLLPQFNFQNSWSQNCQTLIYYKSNQHCRSFSTNQIIFLPFLIFLGFLLLTFPLYVCFRPHFLQPTNCHMYPASRVIRHPKANSLPSLKFLSLVCSLPSFDQTLYMATHKQRCKQTDKAQWKANDEGRMQIEELSVCKYDRLRMIADTERGLFDSIDCTQ